MSDNGGSLFRICCELGELKLDVDGKDEEWVRETFQEEWEARLEEAANMKGAVRDMDSFQ